MDMHYLYIPNEETRILIAQRIKRLYEGLTDTSDWYATMLLEAFEKIADGYVLIGLPHPIIYNQ